MPVYYCNKCHKWHQVGYKCTVGKPRADRDAFTIRGSRKWHNKAEEIKERSGYLCAVCKEEGRYTYNNLEVHHINKLQQHTGQALDDDNLICLCVKHHKLADSGAIDADYLRQLVAKRDGK